MITMLRTLSTMQSNLNGRRQVADLSRQLQEAGADHIVDTTRALLPMLLNALTP